MRTMIVVATLLMCFQMTQQLKTEAPYFYKDNQPQILAHRGDCGIYPEHSEVTQRIAMYLGADFIEPDLQPTKDHKLILIHDWLNETTNVASFPEFASRLTTKTIEGEQVTEWFPEDFTVEELKRLRRKQRFPNREQQFNWQFEILTVEEYIEMAIKENQYIKAQGKKVVGGYFEIKKSEYFTSLGFNVDQMLLDVLKKYNLDTIKGCENVFPIVLQNFEQGSLNFFKERTDLPLVLLTEDPTKDFNLEEVAKLYHGIAPHVSFVLGSDLVKKAHEMDLTVTVWTIRDDQLSFGNSPCEQIQILKELDVDGIFIEYVDAAVKNMKKIICEDKLFINLD